MNKLILISLLTVFSNASFSSAVNMKVGDSEDKLYEIEGEPTQLTQLTVKNKLFVTYFYQATNTSYVVDKAGKIICKISSGKIEGTCP